MAWAINAGLDAPESRRIIAMALRLDRGGELYRSVLRRALDWIDQQFSAEQRVVSGAYSDRFRTGPGTHMISIDDRIEAFLTGDRLDPRRRKSIGYWYSPGPAAVPTSGGRIDPEATLCTCGCYRKSRLLSFFSMAASRGRRPAD